LKRFFLILLLALAFLAVFPDQAALAQTEKKMMVSVSPTYQMNSGPAREELEEYVNMTEFRTYLDANLKACNESIDISSYRIPLDEYQALSDYVYKEIPEAFHVGLLSFSYYSNSSDIAEIDVDYSMSKSSYDTYLKECREIADEMLEGLDHPSLTDEDKALILHDRLALHNSYDYTFNAPYAHEMLGALVFRSSVCEGYAMAYSYLLDQVGIRNYYVSSTLLNHGWNMVYIDGVPYHVDVTWDDPYYGQAGSVEHDNFLRSTEGFIATGHHVNGAYDYDSSAVDTRYDSAFWQTVCTAYQVIDGELYYVYAGGVFNPGIGGTKLMRVRDGGDEVVAEIFDNFETDGYWYGDGYQKLASDGRDLIYSTGHAVYRYCTMTKSLQQIWTPVLPSETLIFGLLYEGGELICVPSDTPYYEPDYMEDNLIRMAYLPHAHVHDHVYTDACDATCNVCEEERVPPHSYDDAQDLICNGCGHDESAYTPGDLDGKPGVDTDDAIYLLFYINFEETYPVYQPVDFDGSGVVDTGDAIYLLFHINFSDSYPLL